MRIISYNLLKEHWRGDFESIKAEPYETAVSFVFNTYVESLIPIARVLLSAMLVAVGDMKAGSLVDYRSARMWLIREVFSPRERNIRNSGMTAVFSLHALYMLIEHPNDRISQYYPALTKKAGIKRPLEEEFKEAVSSATVNLISRMPEDVGWFITDVSASEGLDPEAPHQKVVRAFYEWHHDIGRLKKEVDRYIVSKVLSSKMNAEVTVAAEAFVPEDSATVGEEVPEKSRELWGMKRGKKLTRLYHATAMDNVPKIKKDGLLPKSSGRKGAHPPRLYLVANQDRAFEIATALQEHEVEIMMNNPEAAEKMGLEEPRSYAILMVDVEELPEHFKVYQDPMYSGGFFSYKPIPASAVVMLDEVEPHSMEEYQEFL